MDDLAKSLDEGNNAVTLSLSYAECYPGIDIVHLIPVLDELQSSIVELAHLIQKPGKHVSTSKEISAHKNNSHTVELIIIFNPQSILFYHKVQRTLLAIQADSKADHSVLQAAEDSALKIDSIVTKCRISAYNTRALKQVLSQTTTI